MAGRRGVPGRGKSGGGSWISTGLLLFFLTIVLFPLFFFAGRGFFSSSTFDERTENSLGSHKQKADWRQKLAAKHLKPLLSKEART